MTTETIFTHDADGRLVLGSTGIHALDDLARDLIRIDAEIRALREEMRMFGARTNPLRDHAALAGIREDRG